MSLLSDTNHSPQRIHALLRLLDAQGGQLTFDNIKAWFKPAMRGVEQRGSDTEHVNIRQLLGATASLGMIETSGQNQYRLAGPIPQTLEAFADVVHDKLVGLPWDHADSIVLEAFAAMVVLTESEQGTAWLDVNAKDRAARINGAIRPDKDETEDENSKRFNVTKSSPWKRWVIFLGLGIPLPRGDLYPYPVQRLVRELDRLRAQGGSPDSFKIEAFLAVIAERMPYLDGGRLFKSSVAQVRLPPLERKVSRVLSGALRDLHDDERLRLATVGDAKQTYAMAPEPHALRSIKTVNLEMAAIHA